MLFSYSSKKYPQISEKTLRFFTRGFQEPLDFNPMGNTGVRVGLGLVLNIASMIFKPDFYGMSLFS